MWGIAPDCPAIIRPLLLLLNIFYNIINSKNLPDFQKDLIFNNLCYLRHIPDVQVPFEGTKFGLAFLSVFLEKFINIILVNSYNLTLIDFHDSFLNKL